MNTHIRTYSKQKKKNESDFREQEKDVDKGNEVGSSLKIAILSNTHFPSPGGDCIKSGILIQAMR